MHFAESSSYGAPSEPLYRKIKKAADEIASMASKCQLCQENLPSQKELVTYERIRHRNNKTIPHRKLLIQPPLEQVTFYQDALIVLVKKRCEQRLKQLINYDNWNVLQDPKLKTIDYVLFKDHDSSYGVNFSWSQSEFKENNHIFQCGTATCKFIADSGEFSEQPAAISQTNQVTSQALGLPQVHQIDSNKSSSDDKSTQKKDIMHKQLYQTELTGLDIVINMELDENKAFIYYQKSADMNNSNGMYQVIPWGFEKLPFVTIMDLA
ncbi:hypothetical protein C2G38_2186300 [Gigaspora rosea]|uniref:Uncharacterized protein n=1 Tax=Gigaspora rosea TaxID=44941 RepID=A0A397V5W8_9GLOM|nr:hypothetical protein C2G38_2186300 [Gigaspora rosea]